MSDPKTKVKTKEVQQVQPDWGQTLLNLFASGGKPQPAAFKVVTARVIDDSGNKKIVKARIPIDATLEEVRSAFEQGTGVAISERDITAVPQKAPLAPQPQMLRQAPDVVPQPQPQFITEAPPEEPFYAPIGRTIAAPVTHGWEAMKAASERMRTDPLLQTLPEEMAARPVETLAGMFARPERAAAAAATTLGSGFGGLTLASPVVPQLRPLAYLAGGTQALTETSPEASKFAGALLAPVTSLTKPESQFGQDIASIADIALLGKGLGVAGRAGKAFKAGLAGEAPPVPEVPTGTEFGARLLPIPQRGRDLVDWASAEGLSRLNKVKKAVREKDIQTAEAEAADMRVSPDALLHGRGGVPFGAGNRGLVIGSPGQIHGQMYESSRYTAGSSMDRLQQSFDLIRNPKMINGRFSSDGTVVSIWGDANRLPRQLLLDTLMDLVTQKKLKPDAMVFFTEPAQSVSLRKLFGGEQFAATTVPLPDVTTPEFADRVKRMAADIAARNYKDNGSTTDPLTGEPVTKGYAVSVFPDLTRKVEGKDPAVVEPAVQEYFAQHRELINQNPKIKIGTWFDGEQTWIDLVHGEKTAPAAERMGKAANQKAAFALESQTELPTGGTGEMPAGLAGIPPKERIARLQEITKPTTEKMLAAGEEMSREEALNKVRQAEQLQKEAVSELDLEKGFEGQFAREAAEGAVAGFEGRPIDAQTTQALRKKLESIGQAAQFEAGVVPLPDIGTPEFQKQLAQVTKKLVFYSGKEGEKTGTPQAFVNVRSGKRIDDGYIADILPETVVTLKTPPSEATITKLIEQHDTLLREFPNLSVFTRTSAETGETQIGLAPVLNLKEGLRVAREQGITTLTHAKKGNYTTVDVPLAQEALTPKGAPAERLTKPEKVPIQPLTPEQQQYMKGRFTEERPEYQAENVYDLYRGKLQTEQEKRGIQPITSVKDADAMEQRFIETVTEPAQLELRRLEEAAAAKGEPRRIWYNDHQKALDILSDYAPDLKGDPAKQKAISAIMSVMSNGQTIRAEIGSALPIIKEFLQTGKFPDYKLTVGTRGEAMTNGFATLNRLLDKFNGDLPKAMDWLFSKHPIEEMSEIKPNYQREMAGDQYGAMVLGGKIGPYLLNKFGITDVITKDSWFNRTWRAAMNSFKEKVNPYKEQVQMDDASIAAEKMIMDRAMFKVAEKLGVTGPDLQAILWDMERRWAEKYNPQNVEFGTHLDYMKELADNGELGRVFVEKGGAIEGAGQVPRGTGLQKGFSRQRGRAGAIVEPGAGAGETTFGLSLFPDIKIKDAQGNEVPLEKYAGSININRLNIPDEAKKRLHDYAEKFKKDIEGIIGETPLTHDEIINMALDAEPFKNIIGRDKQAKIASEVLKLRQMVAEDAKNNFAGEGAADRFKSLQSVANFAGRLLGSFRIQAEGTEWGTKERIISKLMDITGKTDEIMRRAQGIDWNDRRQVDRFIRDYVKPNTYDILEEMRYIGLLSSPRTHIVNAFSNMLQVGFTAPLTRAVHGGVDFIESALTGEPRKVYASEVGPYAKEAVKAIPTAWRGAMDALVGKTSVLKPDFERLPTLGEADRWYMKPISKLNEKTRFVTNALEASDIFFRTIAEKGELAALIQRAEKQGKQITPELLKELEQQAKDTAQYLVFRKALDPANKTRQGEFLSKIDSFTAAFMQAAKHAPELRWIVPFVQTPMNIFKQGIEYSPMGLGTLKGAGLNKSLQLSKALVGSMVTTGAAMLVANNETTWDVPTSPSDKADFYAQGKLPYSIKVGNKWIQINKLGPLAYPIAMAMIAKHQFTKGGIQSVPAGLLKFLGEQSYMQGLKNFTDALDDPEAKAEAFFTQMAKQAIPLSSLLRWTNGFVDRTQRAPEGMVDRIFTDIPGLSKEVTARATPFGEEAQKPDLGANLLQLSPLNVGKEPDNKIITELGKRGITVGIPSRSLLGELKLPQSRYQEYIKRVGELTMQELRKWDLSTMGDMELQDAVDELVSDIRKSVRDEMFGSEMENIRNEQERKEREKKR